MDADKSNSLTLQEVIASFEAGPEEDQDAEDDAE